MDASLLNWALCAILLFWCVGLYQRLLRLRLQLQDALAVVERSLFALCNLVAESGSDGVPTGESSWDTLVSTVRMLPQHTQVARDAHMARAPLQALAKTMDAVFSAWEQVQTQQLHSLVSMPVEQWVQRWRDTELEARAARSAFNHLVQDYNLALRQFPASLVVRLMGFRAAVTL